MKIAIVGAGYVGRGTAADTIGAQRAQLVLGKKGASEHEQYLEGRLDDWRGCLMEPMRSGAVTLKRARRLEGRRG